MKRRRDYDEAPCKFIGDMCVFAGLVVIVAIAFITP